MVLGVHVRTGGNLAQAPEVARELGCNTMQIFSRNPQMWRRPKLSEAEIEEFRSRCKQSAIRPVFIHIPYLINLASPEERLYNISLHAYIEDIRQAHKLGADYIVTHMGSHKETSEAQGLRRLSGALNKIIAATKETPVGILLENTSGSGSWLGYNFSHQCKVYDKVKEKTRLGLCLDTAHAYAAGYDLASEQGLEQMLAEIEQGVGLKEIKLVHLNDSQGRLGSRLDRHADIGKGFIGEAGMRRVINHPFLRDLPFILETPKETEDDDARNLKVVRSLRKED